MTTDLNILAGGEAGQGIQTVGFILGKTLVEGGWHVFADQDYESRIRGGHNFFRVRASDLPLRAQKETLDILVALNRETLSLHLGELDPQGVILMDCKGLQTDPGDPRCADTPLQELAEASGGKIMANSVAVGAVLGLLGFDFAVLGKVLNWHFAKADAQIREGNLKAARAGFDYAGSRFNQRTRQRLSTRQAEKRLFISGNEAICLGALAAGCQFLAAYPMTPTTPILEILIDKGRDLGLAALQPEDEIAAINMVAGASFAGVRAMTATSGSGFALMVEGIGLLGMTECPAVIVLGQRPGPAVGLPTRTEQGELLFAIRSNTGEIPKAVLTPANAQEAFWSMIRAFNLADKFQTPVIVLTDTHLSNCYADVADFELDKVRIERGALVSAEEAGHLQDYARYALSESGVSPRALPLQVPDTVVADADEHDVKGHLIEAAEDRNKQVEKRLRKEQGLRREIEPPFSAPASGAELILVGWGSTLGAIREAAELLSAQGRKTSVLNLGQVWPFPIEEVTSALSGGAKSVVVESNAGGQLAELIREQTGLRASAQVHRYDGRPISARYIVERLAEVG